MREDRAVARAGEHHRHPGRPGGVDDEPADVHPAAFELVAEEATERVVADDAAEADAEPQTCRAGRHDRSGAADGEARLVDEPLRLTERGLDVAGQHEVGVRVAEDEEIQRVGHARTIPEAARGTMARRRLGEPMRPMRAAISKLTAGMLMMLAACTGASNEVPPASGSGTGSSSSAVITRFANGRS